MDFPTFFLFLNRAKHAGFPMFSPRFPCIFQFRGLCSIMHTSFGNGTSTTSKPRFLLRCFSVVVFEAHVCLVWHGLATVILTPKKWWNHHDLLGPRSRRIFHQASPRLVAQRKQPCCGKHGCSHGAEPMSATLRFLDFTGFLCFDFLTLTMWKQNGIILNPGENQPCFNKLLLQLINLVHLFNPL